MLAAEEAGAVAAIIINSENTMMPMGEDEASRPTIPSIQLPLAAGQALREALAASSGGLWGTVRPLQGQHDSISREASPASTASAASLDGRPAAESPPVQQSQAPSISSDQCGEGDESEHKQNALEMAHEMGIDDYYSPEEDMDEGEMRNCPVCEDSCQLDRSAQSTEGVEGSILPVGPQSWHEEKGQGESL